MLSAGCNLLGSREPDSAQLAASRQYVQRGKTAAERRDWQAAESYFAQAVKASPEDALARRNYAEVLWQRGARQQAMSQAAEALRLLDDPAAAVQLGEMELETGRLDEARRLAESALDANPQASSAWALRGRIAVQQGLLQDALYDFHRAIEFAPGDETLLLEIAEVYRALGDPHRALAVLVQLQERDTDGESLDRTLYLKGLAQAALGRHADAVDSYRLVLERKAPTAEVLAALSESQLRAGDLEAAAQSAQGAIALEPDHRAGRLVWEKIQGLRMVALPRE